MGVDDKCVFWFCFHDHGVAKVNIKTHQSKSQSISHFLLRLILHLGWLFFIRWTVLSRLGYYTASGGVNDGFK